MPATATDRLEALRGLVSRILIRDARKLMAAGKGDFFSREELDAFMVLPDSVFPLVERGVTFKNKAELQVARNAAEPGKTVSASLRGSMDRIEAFAKGRLVSDGDVPTINVQRMYVAIPQPPQGELAAHDRVLVLRKNERGEVVARREIEAEAVVVAK